MLLSLSLTASLVVPQASAEPPHRSALSAPLRLVVVVTVDQLPPDQLDRLAPWWTGGFARFREHGRRFSQAFFEHGRTETGPGHATIGTGLHPKHHGIVSNHWFEGDAKTLTYCVFDPDVSALTTEGVADTGRYRASGRSPRRIRAPGLGDYLKAADDESQVVSISSKDRSAIPLAGQHPDWALWWDHRGAGGFMSSTWYGEALPAWVSDWNATWVERLLSGPFGDGWKADLPTDERFRTSETEPDDRPGEAGASRTFPHPLPPVADPPSERDLQRLAHAVYAGPAGDAFVLDLAQTALASLALGRDDHVDLLALSLSSTDTIGHDHGPRSREVTDGLLRVDARLGELFERIDAQVGADRWVAVLTADHGVLPLPEALVQRGFPAARAPAGLLEDAGEEVRAHLVEDFGSDFGLRATGRGLRFSSTAMDAAGVDPAEVRREAARRLATASAEFASYAWTLEELRDAAAIAQPRGSVAVEEEAARILRLESGSFDAERTLDVVLTPRRYHLLGVSAGTSHGTPWEYDRQVPLIFLGPGFAKGLDDRAATPADIVPTLLERLGIDVPEGLDGVVLGEG